MVAYSFKPQFVEPIALGTKRQTIRAERRRHAWPGEELQLYTGMRTRSCRLIRRATCISVDPITLHFADANVEYGDRRFFLQQDLDAFARMDGFPDWWAMRTFWRETHGAALPDPWTGVLIRWSVADA